MSATVRKVAMQEGREHSRRDRSVRDDAVDPKSLDLRRSSRTKSLATWMQGHSGREAGPQSQGSPP